MTVAQKFGLIAHSFSDFPAPVAALFGMQDIASIMYAGPGYFAGQAPDPEDPDSPDGRFRILNVPSRGRVTIMERASQVIVAETMSADNGTWLVEHLNPDIYYTVIGWDDRGLQNAAIQDWVKPAVPA